MNPIQAFLLFLALLVGVAMLAFPPVENIFGDFIDYRAVTELGYGKSVDIALLAMQFVALGAVTFMLVAVTGDPAQPMPATGSTAHSVIRKGAEPFASPRDVLIQHHAGTLMASSVATGKELWRVTLATDGNVITRIDGNALLACCAGEISCIDIHSGDLIWQRRFEGTPLHVIHAQPTVPAQRPSRHPAFTGSASSRNGPLPDATRHEHNTQTNTAATAEPLAEFIANAFATLLLRWSFHPGRLVFSDGRLLFSQRGLFGLTTTREELPWHKIAGFSYRSGFFWDSLDIETRGQSRISFVCIDKADADRLQRLMRDIES